MRNIGRGLLLQMCLLDTVASPAKRLNRSGCRLGWDNVVMDSGVEGNKAVSYTHLTLPTNREV